MVSTLLCWALEAEAKILMSKWSFAPRNLCKCIREAKSRRDPEKSLPSDPQGGPVSWRGPEPKNRRGPRAIF